ncbi:MAG: hypothetical protein ACXACD_11380 [Candidatus Thorarchaeota archaeon]|jgi:hypothetical protein
MAFSDKAEFKIPRHIVQPGAVNPETITVNKTLVYSDAQYQVLRNNTGSLDCILPSYKDGASFWIKNRASSTHNIVVKDEDANTIATLGANEGLFVVSDGVAWWDIIKG